MSVGGTSSQPGWIFAVLAVGFVAAFRLIARIGGWEALGQRYRFDGSFQGERRRFQSATFRYAIGYNGCLTIGASSSGMLVAVFFPFRLWHPSLFIPWEEVTGPTEGKKWFVQYLEFRFRQEPDIPFRVNRKLGRWIAERRGWRFVE